MAGEIAGGEDVFQTVFRQLELVKQFKNCWRIRNYYVNRATRAWAISADIEIEPVLFRGDVDGYEAAALHGVQEPLLTLIRIGAMVWPPDIDPTAIPDLVALSEGCAYHRSKRHRVTWMEMLMSMHAAHIRRLSVHMSMCLDLSPLHDPGMNVNALGLGWKCTGSRLEIRARQKLLGLLGAMHGDRILEHRAARLRAGQCRYAHGASESAAARTKNGETMQRGVERECDGIPPGVAPFAN